MGPKRILSMKKKFGSAKYLVFIEILGPNKIFGPKEMESEKILGLKKFWPKIILALKHFCSKKMLSLKKI